MNRKGNVGIVMLVALTLMLVAGVAGFLYLRVNNSDTLKICNNLGYQNITDKAFELSSGQKIECDNVVLPGYYETKTSKNKDCVAYDKWGIKCLEYKKTRTKIFNSCGSGWNCHELFREVK